MTSEARVVESIDEAARWSERMRAAGLSLGLVPTMGALHAGHLSLIERSVAECDRTIVTIYVNPTQFGAEEDLEAYPRTPEEDVEACRRRGVDLVLIGRSHGAGAVYSEDFQTWVRVEELTEPLCGVFRPGHFRGVATVVSILFGALRPHRAYFGQKDFQQSRVIEQLARDLRTGVEVRVLPIVRDDADGLALSSRNRRLDARSREVAGAIPRALAAVEARFVGGETRAEELEAVGREVLEAGEGLEIQYASVLDAWTLRSPGATPVDALERGAVFAVAAVVGGVRLIDNVLLAAAGSSASAEAVAEEGVADGAA